jgi:mono/diheme cytochrome c family protein
MMKLNKYLLLVVLSAFILVLAGCGADKTENETTYDGGGSSTGTTPNAFTFTNMTGVQLGATVTSNSITVSGITQAVPISVTGGSYSIGTGDFTTSAGTVTNGQTVTVQQTASASNSTTTTTTLTIGGVSASFNVTTVAAAGGGGGNAANGQTLFTSTCSACHTATSLANTTLTAIQSASMTHGLSTAQLQDIVAYLATQ